MQKQVRTCLEGVLSIGLLERHDDDETVQVPATDESAQAERSGPVESAIENVNVVPLDRGRTYHLYRIGDVVNDKSRGLERSEAVQFGFNIVVLC